MKTISLQVLLLLIIVLTSIFSCKKEENFTPVCDSSNPTYDADIKAIIDGNCMGTFCHNAGANRGDFTSYTGLEPVLNNGAFKDRVLVKQDMPKGNRKTLTQEEINKLQCWLDNNYPEN